jgi:hypothetical protein
MTASRRVALVAMILVLLGWASFGCTALQPPTSPSPNGSPTEMPTGSFSSPPPTPLPSSTNHVEPDAGAFRMTTAPSRAADEWSVLFRSDDGRQSREPEVFDPDDAVVVVQLQLPGVFRVILNDEVCEGSFEIAGKWETQILVEVPETGGCFVTVTGSRQLP